MKKPSGGEVSFRCVAQCPGKRLDLFLADCIKGVSRKKIKQALDGGRIFVDGRVARRAGQILQGDERIEGTLFSNEALPLPQVSVVYRDADLLVVDKPAGLPSHLDHLGQDSALGQVCALLKDAALPPVLLHRLDRDTSGLLLFALHQESNRALYRQFSERRVEKSYLALVKGQPPAFFSAASRLKPGVRGRTVVVDQGGFEAQTDFTTLAYGRDVALVEAHPRTGRTHQIRVHLAAQGYPLLGDALYRGTLFLRTAERHLAVPRHFLHAHRLRFCHPCTDQLMTLECAPPQDFAPVLDLLDDSPFKS